MENHKKSSSEKAGLLYNTLKCQSVLFVVLTVVKQERMSLRLKFTFHFIKEIGPIHRTPKILLFLMNCSIQAIVMAW